MSKTFGHHIFQKSNATIIKVIKQGRSWRHLLQDPGHKMLPLPLPLNVQSPWCQGYHRTSWLFQQHLLSQGVLLYCDKQNKTHGAPEVTRTKVIVSLSNSLTLSFSKNDEIKVLFKDWGLNPTWVLLFEENQIKTKKHHYISRRQFKLTPPLF